MENLPVSNMIGSGIWFLAQLTILIFSLVLLIKRPSLPPILMLIGMALSVIFGTLGFLVVSFMARQGPQALIDTQGTLSVLNGLALLTFAIGLGLFILKTIKRPA